MTVGELKAILADMPDDAVVVSYTEDYFNGVLIDNCIYTHLYTDNGGKAFLIGCNSDCLGEVAAARLERLRRI